MILRDYLNEVKIDDIYNKTYDWIPQGDLTNDTTPRMYLRNKDYKYPIGLKPKEDEFGNYRYAKSGRIKYELAYGTASMDSAYYLEYVNNSYYHSGVFKFLISTDRNPKGGYSYYEMMVKPKRRPQDINDLINNVDVDVFCACNDFRFVFMDKAYKGAFGLSKYGIFPIRDRIINANSLTFDYTVYNSKIDGLEEPNMSMYNDPGLPRIKMMHDTGREDAPTRNPMSRGSVCKHLIFLIDGINNQTIDLDLVNEEIITREKLINDGQLFTRDETYGRVEKSLANSRQKVIEMRKHKVRTILNITADDIINKKILKYNYEIDDIDSVKRSFLQDLANFDEYYVSRAYKEERENVHYYLPEDWQESYDMIDKHFNNLKVQIDEIDFNNRIKYFNNSYNDDAEQLLNSYIKNQEEYNNSLNIFQQDTNIKGNEIDFNSPFENLKHIKNFRDFIE